MRVAKRTEADGAVGGVIVHQRAHMLAPLRVAMGGRDVDGGSRGCRERVMCSLAGGRAADTQWNEDVWSRICAGCTGCAGCAGTRGGTASLRTLSCCGPVWAPCPARGRQRARTVEIWRETQWAIGPAGQLTSGESPWADEWLLRSYAPPGPDGAELRRVRWDSSAREGRHSVDCVCQCGRRPGRPRRS